MKESWFHNLPKRFHADKAEVPEHLWDRIADGLFESKIKSRFESNSEEAVPHALQEKMLQQFDAPAKLVKTGFMRSTWTYVIGTAASLVLVFGSYFLWNQTRPTQVSISLNTSDSEANTRPNRTGKTVNNEKNPLISGEAATELPRNIPQKKFSAHESLNNAESQAINSFGFGGNPTQNVKIPMNAEAGSREYSMMNAQNSYPDLPQEWARLDVVCLELKPTPIYLNMEALHYPLPGNSKHNFFKKPSSNVWQFAIWKQVMGPNLTKEKEHGTLSLTPMQRQFGLSARLGKRNGINMGFGVFKSRSLYRANIQNAPFFKTPLRVNPSRKYIAVKSSYYNRELPEKSGVFVPNGFRIDDTLNFFRVNYSESFEIQAVEVPLYLGYAIHRGSWRFFPSLGGRVFLPSKINSEVFVEVLNPQKTQFALINEHEVKSRLSLQPFAQMELQFQVSKKWLLSANALLPFRNKRQEDAGSDYRAQLGLCYEF